MEMSLSGILILLISAIFIDNFIFSKFLGCCPFLGVSKKPDTALGSNLTPQALEEGANYETDC